MGAYHGDGKGLEEWRLNCEIRRLTLRCQDLEAQHVVDEVLIKDRKHDTVRMDWLQKNFDGMTSEGVPRKYWLRFITSGDVPFGGGGLRGYIDLAIKGGV